MLWYCIHNILKLVSPTMESQHRNLTTFLTGVVLYTLFYSYVGTLGTEHSFLSVFFKYSIYIVIADAFAMAILYKNYYHHSIFKEVEETLGATKPEATLTPQFDPNAVFKTIERNKRESENSLLSKIVNVIPDDKLHKIVRKMSDPRNEDNHDEDNDASESVPLLANDSYNDDDLMQGFAKQSALEGVFTQTKEQTESQEN